MHKIAIFVCLSFSFASETHSEIVKNLQGVTKVLKETSHKSHFEEEMSGKVKDNNKVSCQTLATLFGRPKLKHKWSQQKCDAHAWEFKGKPAFAVALLHEGEEGDTLDIGIVNSLNSPKLLTKLDDNMKADEDEGEDSEEGVRLNAFDPVLFDLGRLGRAVGIRFNKGGCGAGGSLCADGILRLYILENEKMRKVFDSQLDYYASWGGAWNEDGTREHDVQEEKAVLVITNKGNPPNLIKKRVGSKDETQTFIWDAENKAYRTQDKDFLSTVAR